MSEQKFLDKTGLSTFLAKLKTIFASKTHIHDDRYFTETEVNSKLSEKANANHTHSNFQGATGSNAGSSGFEIGRAHV
mgnify:FL=1